MKIIRGFTLVELLVVIVIIGILGTLSVYTLSSYFDRARRAKVEAEASSLIRAIKMARTLRDGPLFYITSKGCSDCSCRTGEEINTLADGHACIVNMKAAFELIATQANMDLGSEDMRDPWGSVYLIDENEGEYSGVDYCRKDNFRSAGPDAILGNADDIVLTDTISFYDTKQCGG